MEEENRDIIDLEWDTYRTIFGMGRIGYTLPLSIIYVCESRSE